MKSRQKKSKKKNGGDRKAPLFLCVCPAKLDAAVLFFCTDKCAKNVDYKLDFAYKI